VCIIRNLVNECHYESKRPLGKSFLLNVFRKNQPLAFFSLVFIPKTPKIKLIINVLFVAILSIALNINVFFDINNNQNYKFTNFLE
jgi:hypothetical protein